MSCQPSCALSVDCASEPLNQQRVATWWHAVVATSYHVDRPVDYRVLLCREGQNSEAKIQPQNIDKARATRFQVTCTTTASLAKHVRLYLLYSTR